MSSTANPTTSVVPNGEMEFVSSAHTDSSPEQEHASQSTPFVRHGTTLESVQAATTDTPSALRDVSQTPLPTQLLSVLPMTVPDVSSAPQVPGGTMVSALRPIQTARPSMQTMDGAQPVMQDIVSRTDSVF